MSSLTRDIFNAKMHVSEFFKEHCYKSFNTLKFYLPHSLAEDVSGFEELKPSARYGFDRFNAQVKFACGSTMRKHISRGGDRARDR